MEFIWDTDRRKLVGETLRKALLNEFKEDPEHSLIGKEIQKAYEEQIEYNCSEETDEEYAEYCKESNAEVPDDKGEKPVCKCCGSKLLSRYEWAEDRESYFFEEFYAEDWLMGFTEEQLRDKFGYLEPELVIMSNGYERPFESWMLEGLPRFVKLRILDEYVEENDLEDALVDGWLYAEVKYDVEDDEVEVRILGTERTLYLLLYEFDEVVELKKEEMVFAEV